MEILKHFLVYSLCAVAVILHQNFVHGADECVSCDSGNPLCNNSAIDAKNITTRCTPKTDELCGTATMKVNDTVLTVRGCFNCDDQALENYTKLDGWNCETCSSNLCNTEAISSGATSGHSLVPLLLSSVVALYYYQ